MALVTYFQRCNDKGKAKPVEGFKAGKCKVVVGMEAFRDSSEFLTKLISDKSISFADVSKA